MALLWASEIWRFRIHRLLQRIGSGIGFGVPIGGPTVSEASDQYVTSALITVPPDYQQHWSQYRLEVAAGNQAMGVAAPAPAG